MNQDNGVAPLCDVSRETIEALRHLEAEALKWTKKINLVSRSTQDQIWDRHIRDSAYLHQFIPEGSNKILDIGSGGGFPALVLAIIDQDNSNRHYVLCESDKRKCAFLNKIAIDLNLSATVIPKRIESLEKVKPDVITSRALAPLSKLLGYASEQMVESGLGIFPKGINYREEIEESSKTWDYDLDARPSMAPSSAVLLIKNIRAKKPHV